MSPEAAIWIAIGAMAAATLFSTLYMSLSDLRRGKLEEIALRKSTHG